MSPAPPACSTWPALRGGLPKPPSDLILGTTGVVIPYSCSAWIHGINSGVDVARAAGLQHVAGATGRTSEAAVRSDPRNDWRRDPVLLLGVDPRHQLRRRCRPRRRLAARGRRYGADFRSRRPI